MVPSRWVDLARSGDRAAQRQLFEMYQTPLYNYLRRMVRDDACAADLAQETFVRAFRHLPRLKDDGAFRGWLYRIAHNLVRDRQPAPATEPWDESQSPADPTADPARRLEQAELAQAVDAAIAALPPPQRELVVLHHLEGFEIEELARLLRLPAGTIKSRLGRARERLRRRLTPFVED